MAQAARRSSPTAGAPSSLLCHSMWVLSWTKRDLGGEGILPFFLPVTSYYHFSTFVLIHFVSFHPPLWWCAGMVGRHPCYSQTFRLHRISPLDPALCPTKVENLKMFIIIILIHLYPPCLLSRDFRSRFCHSQIRRLEQDVWRKWICATVA